MEITKDTVNEIMDTIPDEKRTMDVIEDETGAKMLDMVPFLITYTGAVQDYLKSKEGK
jgi:hypothetical protein